MAKKKQKEEEKSEEQNQAFLAQMANVFLNEAEYNGYSVDDLSGLAISLACTMVQVSYIAAMPKDMSEDAKRETSEKATMYHMAYYGRCCEKSLRKKGLTYGGVKKSIMEVIANKKKVAKDKEE